MRKSFKININNTNKTIFKQGIGLSIGLYQRVYVLKSAVLLQHLESADKLKLYEVFTQVYYTSIIMSRWSLKPVVQHFTLGTKQIFWRTFKHQNTFFLPHSPQVLLFKCLIIALTHRTRTITNSSYFCITDCSLPSFVISVHVIESR